MKEIAIRLLKAQDIRLDTESVTVIPVRGRRHKVSFRPKNGGNPQTMILRFNVPPMMAAA